MKISNQISVIGKIVLSDAQRRKLIAMGATYIAESNPATRNASEVLGRIGTSSVVLNNISTPITAEVMAACPNLKFIQTWSTGTDNIDLIEAKKRGIKVANVPDFSTEAVAEKTLGLMIMAANHFHKANAHVRAGGWDYQMFRGLELRGKTLCLVGHGHIGKRVEELAHAFGMIVIVINQKNTVDELNMALNCAQFVSLHCPLTAQTKHLIGAKQFSFMHNVILINNSRGGVVDELALLCALNEKRVKFATLDVFENEPPPADHPLLHHEFVYVTPHCAWNTEESVSKLTEVAINQIDLFLKSELHDFVV